jgi:predicted small lipoprotein YifL
MAGGADVRPVLIIVALLGMAVLVLVACGKKGPPSPPGPPDQITWPRVYPTY